MTQNTKLPGEDKEGWFDNQIRGRKTQKMRHTDINRHITSPTSQTCTASERHAMREKRQRDTIGRIHEDT
jgi:hypothetical protein